MKYKFTFFLLLPFLFLTAMAQTKQRPTLDDLMWGGTNYWNLQPPSVHTTWWGDALVQTNVNDVRMILDAKGKKLGTDGQVLFDLAALNNVLDTARYGKARNLIGTTFPEGTKTVAKITLAKAIVACDW